jgi:hypothetical protein
LRIRKIDKSQKAETVEEGFRIDESQKAEIVEKGFLKIDKSQKQRP